MATCEAEWQLKLVRSWAASWTHSCETMWSLSSYYLPTTLVACRACHLQRPALACRPALHPFSPARPTPHAFVAALFLPACIH